MPDNEKSIRETFDTGAVREKKKEQVRYDLITPIGLRRLAETYGEGAVKYGDRNWEKGIPASNLMNHLMDHINKYNAGDRSEDHLAHATWGLFAIMHFEEESANPNHKEVRDRIILVYEHLMNYRMGMQKAIDVNSCLDHLAIALKNTPVA